MKETASAEIREREEINARLAHFWNLPSWTPAMGVLLISGISPVPGCTEVESSGADLRCPGSAPGQRARHDANRAFERWVEYWDAEAEWNPRTVIPSTITPFDFLRWCQEEYENTPDWTQPGWLRYWLIFTKMEIGAEAPLAVPAHIVDHAVALENFADVTAAKVAMADQRSSATLPVTDSQRMIAAVIASIEADGRIEISGSIIKAIRSTNSVNPGPVWKQLRDMASKREHGLEVIDKSTLWVPQGKDRGEPYTRATLTQWLRRHRGKAAARLGMTQPSAANGSPSDSRSAGFIKRQNAS